MNLINAENILEGIMKQDLHHQNGNNFQFAINLLWGYLGKKNITIRLPLTRIDGSVYLAKKYNHEELLPLIQTAAMDKDFQERNKAQKQLLQKMKPLYDKLKDELFDECKDRKPTISKNSTNDYVIEYKSEVGKPYIKFQTDKLNQKIYLVSYHDQENVLKKKSYNDNSSFKFGSRETKAKIKQELEDAELLKKYEV